MNEFKEYINKKLYDINNELVERFCRDTSIKSCLECPACGICEDILIAEKHLEEIKGP